MDFFDKLGKKATEAYKITADKTGKMAKETKLKLKMGELKSRINDIYEEIGKRVYENHVREDDEKCKRDIEEKCIKIDELSSQIDSLLKECLELKDMKQCSKCYVEIDKSAKFCHNCGEKQENCEKQEDCEKQEKCDKQEDCEKQEDCDKREDHEKQQENCNEEKTNLETTVEVESNPDDKIELTEEEVKNAGAEDMQV